VPREDGAAHGLLQPELHANIEVPQSRPRLPELVLDHLPHARPFLHHEKRLRPELVERDRLAGEPMAGGTGEDDLVVEERLEGDAAVPPARTHDAELELAVGDLADDGLCVGDGQTHAHLRIEPLELAQEQRHDRPAGPRGGAELERPRDFALLVELLEQMLFRGEQPLSRRVEAQPSLRRLDSPAGAVEQLASEPLLERPDLETDGRLRDAEPLGRLGEALALHDRAERRKLTCVHKHSLCKKRVLYDPAVASPPPDSFILRFSDLAEASPKRGRDLVLRTLDLLLSLLFLLVSLPFVLPIAVALLLTSGLPLFYRGARVGRGGHIFDMLKFRTLKPGAEDRLGPYLGEELVLRTKLETTRIGGWLRATQLDEVPQLLNVVRGDMSLVGPRPIRPRFFEELAEELPAYWQRLVVRPGLTGFAQIRRGYETSMAEKLAHDLEWIADRSVRLYLRTLAVTAARVLRQSFRGLFGRD
jgi:lipopolysaccharide/colanic/teichoic acid biosynthesis glycosyltransferase